MTAEQAAAIKDSKTSHTFSVLKGVSLIGNVDRWVVTGTPKGYSTRLFIENDNELFVEFNRRGLIVVVQ